MDVTFTKHFFISRNHILKMNVNKNSLESNRTCGAHLSPLDSRDVVLDHFLEELLLHAKQQPMNLNASSSIVQSNNDEKKEVRLFATHDDITKNPEDGLRRPVYVFDQGNTSMCVAVTGATIVNLQYGITNATPYFAYNCREHKEEDGGMAAKNLLVLAFKYGTPQQTTYPSQHLIVHKKKEGVPLAVTKVTMENALKFKCLGYGRVFSLQTAVDLLELNRSGPFANAFGGLFLIVPMCNDSPRFWQKKNPKKKRSSVWNWFASRKLAEEEKKSKINNNEEDQVENAGGYHCVTILDVSVKQRVFKLQNSWGDSYGNFGCTYFPFDDWNEFATEVWFATNSADLASRIKDRIKTLKTFHNYNDGQLNADNRREEQYNLSNINSEIRSETNNEKGNQNSNSNKTIFTSISQQISKKL